MKRTLASNQNHRYWVDRRRDSICARLCHGDGWRHAGFDGQTITDGQILSILNDVNDHLEGDAEAWIQVKACSGKSKLDGRAQETEGYLTKGHNRAILARIY